MAFHKTPFDLIGKTAFLPISTPKSTATKTTTWVIGPCILDELHVIIPAGHVGLTGLQVLLQGTLIVPYTGTGTLVGNGETVKLPMGIQVPRALTIVTSNANKVANTHYLRAIFHDVPLVTDQPPALDLVSAPMVGG